MASRTHQGLLLDISLLEKDDYTKINVKILNQVSDSISNRYSASCPCCLSSIQLNIRINPPEDKIKEEFGQIVELKYETEEASPRSHSPLAESEMTPPKTFVEELPIVPESKPKTGQRRKDKLKNYVCDHCSGRFTYKKGLKRHLHLHHFPSLQHLYDRFDPRSKLGPRRYAQVHPKLECHHCGKILRGRHSMAYHLHHLHFPQLLLEWTSRKGAAPERLCTECGSFVKKTVFAAHLRRHRDRIDKLRCEHCSRTFSSRTGLRYHLVTQHLRPQEAAFPCTSCPKSFKTRFVLQTHIQNRHTERTRDFVCQTCGMAFYTAGTMKKHRKKHQATLDYECGVCSKRFTTTTCLNQHMLVHFPKKRFACSSCDKVFTRKQAMEIHERGVHRGERNYACEFTGCSSRFYDSGTLRSHFLAHIRKEKGLRGMKLPEVARLFYDPVKKTKWEENKAPTGNQ